MLPRRPAPLSLGEIDHPQPEKVYRGKAGAIWRSTSVAANSVDEKPAVVGELPLNVEHPVDEKPRGGCGAFGRREAPDKRQHLQNQLAQLLGSRHGVEAKTDHKPAPDAGALR